MLVALSGGPDSTALLHLLADLSAELSLQLEAAHFDHRVRAGSEIDAARAVDVAADAGVRCLSGTGTIPRKATQAALREARYRWLRETAGRSQADRIAVGHHADDQAETVLFRIMRGTDLRGLAGMPVRRGRLVRPLLPFRRHELVGYLEGKGVSWTDDPSNRDRRWTRVRMRTEVIPGLEKGGADTVNRLLALGRAAAQAYALSERAAAELLSRAEVHPAPRGLTWLNRQRLVSGGPELLSVALRRLARARGVELTSGGTRTGVEFISEGRSGGRVAIGGRLEVFREFDRITLSPVTVPPAASELPVCGSSGGGALQIGGRAVGFSWSPASASGPRANRIAVAVSSDHYPLMLRSWRDGDRIRLPGGTRKLKKLFGDRRVPVSERARLPVLADRMGNVLWIEGLATAETDRAVARGASLLEFELRHE